MNIIKLAFPSDPKPVVRVRRSECGRVWRIHQPNGYSMNSRRTKRAAVALAQRNFPGYEIRVEE
jgi:hypothetical protein